MYSAFHGPHCPFHGSWPVTVVATAVGAYTRCDFADHIISLTAAVVEIVGLPSTVKLRYSRERHCIRTLNRIVLEYINVLQLTQMIHLSYNTKLKQTS